MHARGWPTNTQATQWIQSGQKRIPGSCIIQLWQLVVEVHLVVGKRERKVQNTRKANKLKKLPKWIDEKNKQFNHSFFDAPSIILLQLS